MATVGNISQIQVGADSYNLQDSNAATAAHTHGNITSDGDITATAPTISSGDQIVINDHDKSKITNGPTFGTSTTTYLRNNGTWGTPIGTQYFDYDGTDSGLVPLWIPLTGTGDDYPFIALDAYGTWRPIAEMLQANIDDAEGVTGSNGYIVIDGNNGLYTDANGSLMSGTEHTKLANIEEYANNYSHPTYTATTAAAIKVGRDATGHVVIGNTLTYSDVGAAASSHAHGNITSGGDITATAPTVASGDKLIINDESASKVTNGPSFGTSTTTFLANNGTWQTPVGTVYNDFTGPTASAPGTHGLVPAPAAGDQVKLLAGNGSWTSKDKVVVDGVGELAGTDTGFLHYDPGAGGLTFEDAATMRDVLNAQDKLVSGTNIKTINNESILGSGNISISGGVTVDSALSDTSPNPVQNMVIMDALRKKMALKPVSIEMEGGGYIDGSDGELVLMPSESGDPYLIMYADGTIAWDDGGGTEVPLSLEGHTHAASDITSGTLADARLPTKGSAGTAGTSSATSGATLAVPYITTDAYGRVTAKGTHTHTINSLAASAISSGTLDTARIPDLAASKITSGTMSQLRVQPIYYQAHGSGTINLAAGTITKVTLASTGALSSGSGLAIASGGIKITTAGRYRITASAYVQNTATAASGRGVYVCKVASSGAFSATAEIFAAVDARGGASSGAICCGPKIVACSANDIVYLAARSIGAAGTCDQDNGGTFLLVERLS